jgi:hypothetical protein
MAPNGTAYTIESETNFVNALLKPLMVVESSNKQLMLETEPFGVLLFMKVECGDTAGPSLHK